VRGTPLLPSTLDCVRTPPGVAVGICFNLIGIRQRFD